jgi:mercuric ion binding protein
MKRLSFLLSVALASFAATAALAAQPAASGRTVTLSVPGMYCPSCPVTVRKALERVPGVHVVGINLDKRTVQVEVTDQHVTNEQLTSTTANAGYPSTVVNAPNHETQ